MNKTRVVWFWFENCLEFVGEFCCALILNLLLTSLFQKRVHFNAIKKDDAILGPIRYLFCCKIQITIFIVMI